MRLKGKQKYEGWKAKNKDGYGRYILVVSLPCNRIIGGGHIL